ncbi:MAG: ComEC/Rec2 family competence protein [Deltaproteobacteria bacterium]|nr:ComEC/Rec2 family competence protein [Candidatus Anaeroferrophillacea bacterium]
MKPPPDIPFPVPPAPWSAVAAARPLWFPVLLLAVESVRHACGGGATAVSLVFPVLIALVFLVMTVRLTAGHKRSPIQVFLFLLVCLGIAASVHVRLGARAAPASATVPAVVSAAGGEAADTAGDAASGRVAPSPVILRVAGLLEFRGRGWQVSGHLMAPAGGFPAGRQVSLLLPAVSYHDPRLPYVGDMLRCRVPPEPCRPPRHPFLETLYDRVAPSRQLAFLRVNDWEQVENLGDSGCRSRLRQLDRCRRLVHERIMTAGSEHPAAAGVLVALVVGTRDTLPAATGEVFADLGVFHLLAISGLHVGLVTGFVFFFVSRLALLLPAHRLIRGAAPVAAAAAIPICWAFVVWTGAGLPAMRAGIMATCLLVAVWWDRTDDPWSALLLAVAIILALWPESLFRPSFQMSVSAVAGILLLMRNYDRLLPPGSGWKSGCRRRVMQCAGVSAAAWLATAPWAAAAFQRLAPWSIPANLFMVPVFSLAVLPAALAALLLLPAPPLYDLLVGFLAMVLDLLLAGAALVRDHLPGAVIPVGNVSGLRIALYYLLLIAIGGLAGRRRPLIFAVLAAGAAIGLGIDFGVAAMGAGNAPERLEIACFVGGSQQAAVVRLPGDGSLLLNGGGWPGRDFSPARQVIAPYLRRQGVVRLDAIVLPSPQDGMVADLDRLVREFAVAEVWYNGIWTGYPPFRSFYDSSRAAGVRWRVMGRGARVRQCGVAVVEPLLPDRDCTVSGLSWRDACRQRAVSIGIDYGVVRVVLWGGAGDPGPADVVIATRTPDEPWWRRYADRRAVRLLVAPDVPPAAAAMADTKYWSTRRHGFLELRIGSDGALTLNGRPAGREKFSPCQRGGD